MAALKPYIDPETGQLVMTGDPGYDPTSGMATPADAAPIQANPAAFAAFVPPEEATDLAGQIARLLSAQFGGMMTPRWQSPAAGGAATTATPPEGTTGPGAAESVPAEAAAQTGQPTPRGFTGEGDATKPYRDPVTGALITSGDAGYDPTAGTRPMPIPPPPGGDYGNVEAFTPPPAPPSQGMAWLQGIDYGNMGTQPAPAPPGPSSVNMPWLADMPAPPPRTTGDGTGTAGTAAGLEGYRPEGDATKPYRDPITGELVRYGDAGYDPTGGTVPMPIPPPPGDDYANLEPFTPSESEGMPWLNQGSGSEGMPWLSNIAYQQQVPAPEVSSEGMPWLGSDRGERDPFGAGVVSRAPAGQEEVVPFQAPEMPQLTDYTSFLSDVLYPELVGRIGAANPYDVRREDILAGPEADIRQSYDEAAERLQNWAAVTGKLGVPYFRDQLRELAEDEARARLGVRSRFGELAAGAEEPMRRGRIADLMSGIQTDLGRQGQLFGQGLATRQLAGQEYGDWYNRRLQSMLQPQQQQDMAINLALSALGGGSPTQTGAAASGALGGSGRMYAAILNSILGGIYG